MNSLRGGMREAAITGREIVLDYRAFLWSPLSLSTGAREHKFWGKP